MGKLITMKIVKTMKNVTIAFILMVSVLSFAQDKSNKKFPKTYSKYQVEN